MGTQLMVIGLNTVTFTPLAPGDNDLAVDSELAWLDARLAAAQAAGQKVWILMHVPPGADEVSTAKAFVANGALTNATVTMMWNQTYQANFLQKLAKYPGVITLILAAHTHTDEYRILSSDYVLDQAPAISPCFGNNPAFKVFTFASHTLMPTDYRSCNYDLATDPTQFNSYYTFSTAYSMQGALDSSLAQLYPALVTDHAKQAVYRGQYYSGNNSVNPKTLANWNPMTDKSWPVFVCGIGEVGSACDHGRHRGRYK